MCERRVPSLLALLCMLVACTTAATERRDPLRPPDHREPSAEAAMQAPVEMIDPRAWALSSTLISAQRRVAIINGLSVRAGEWVAGARVLGIEPDLVRLEVDGRTFTVLRVPSRVHRIPRGQK